MTKEAKAVKFASLACLFVGLFVLGAGIFLLTQDGATAGEGLCAGVGAATVVCGVQCSRLANVPSNAPTIRTMGLVLFVLAAVVAIAGFALKFSGVFETCMCSLAAVCALILFFFAYRHVKALERV